MCSIFFRINGMHYKIKCNEVLYIEARKNYVNIYLTGQKLIVHCSLKQIEEKLPAGLFYRIHKSYIIALDSITKFNREVVYLNAIELPLGPKAYDGLKLKLMIEDSERIVKKLKGIPINELAI